MPHSTVTVQNMNNCDNYVCHKIIIESCIAWVGREPNDHLIPHCSNRVDTHQVRLPRALSNLSLSCSPLSYHYQIGLSLSCLYVLYNHWKVAIKGQSRGCQSVSLWTYKCFLSLKHGIFFPFHEELWRPNANRQLSITVLLSHSPSSRAQEEKIQWRKTCRLR